MADALEGCTAGVRVAKVAPLGSSSGKLQEDDVLLEIDGVEISQDGTVPLRDNERIHFLHMVTKRSAGYESVHLKVWREKSELEVDIPLRPDRWLVPRMDGYDAAAEYTIVGGLVFIPLSRPWADLKCNEKQWNQARALMNQYVGQALSEEGRQVIILSKHDPPKQSCGGLMRASRHGLVRAAAIGFGLGHWSCFAPRAMAGPQRLQNFGELRLDTRGRIVIEGSATVSLLDAWRALWDHVGLVGQESELAPYLVGAKDVCSRGELKLRALAYFAGTEDKDCILHILDQLDSKARDAADSLIQKHAARGMPEDRQEAVRAKAAAAKPAALEALSAARSRLRGSGTADWLPNWVRRQDILQAAIAQIDSSEDADDAQARGKAQERDAGQWLRQHSGKDAGQEGLFGELADGECMTFISNLNVLGGASRRTVPEGIKAEVDGLLLRGDPPELAAIVECKAGTAIYGDLQKLDGLLEFLESGDEQVAHFQVAKPGTNAPRELAVQLPPDGARSVKVKYFLGGLPEDDAGENSLASLLRPSVASQEKGKLLFRSFPPGQQHEESRLELLDVPPDTWLVQATMAEAEVVKAQQRVDEFLDDVRRRYEQGRISFFVREKKWSPRVLAHPCNSGYHSFGNIVLHTFCGEAMRNVAELARAVARCEQQQLVFHFLRPFGDGKELVVLDRSECQTAEAEILAQHLIGSPSMVRIDGHGEPRALDPEADHADATTCLGGLRLGEVQPMVATEPITSPTHLAAQGQWDPSCMGPTSNDKIRSSDTSFVSAAMASRAAAGAGDAAKAEGPVPEEAQFGRVYIPGRWDVANLFLPSLIQVKDNPKATAHFRQKLCARDYDSVKMMLHAGFPPGAALSPRQHRTALFLAAEMGDVLLCQLLLSFRADPFQRLRPQQDGMISAINVEDKGHVRPHPLDVAIQRDHLPIVHLFNMHRFNPPPLDLGVTVPVRQEFPLRLELQANESGLMGLREPLDRRAK
ncbi:Protease Do-like 10, mitochondrial [Symbiodinium microadriaticum]|uniref:Protease Do-like 10, mitochondrial n=1 Tax=Symbiodinium microadriaticum TaxID=2951 RepID=A0A1Q9F1I5_SYMMI|nr:Protease Do-like 10, mitochondrial [Symbiodinium microadriaticum]